jgi:hypothetical protein
MPAHPGFVPGDFANTISGALPSTYSVTFRRENHGNQQWNNGHCARQKTAFRHCKSNSKVQTT